MEHQSEWLLWNAVEEGSTSTTSIWMISTFVFCVDAWLTSIYYGLQIDQLDGFFFFPFFEEHFKLSFDGFIDLDAYDTIAMKLKGDGRCYISTIYTENWINSPGQQEDNSWQAFVFVPKENWYIAKIPLARYLPTWRGNIIDAKLEMNPSRILGMSLSVNAECGVPGAKSGPGDFRMEIDWIKALRTQ